MSAMKHPFTIIIIFLLTLTAFLFLRTTEYYKEFSDPRGYWTQRITSSQDMVRFTA
jgi:predicted membrane chloride channel (bestrophin family)